MHGSEPDITKLYSKFDFLVSHCFSIVFETFSYDDSAWIKGNSPLKSMKNRVNRRV